jgi:hypothetical protein
MQNSMETSNAMLPTPNNLFNRLQPITNKINKGDFKSMVARLQRPYIRLSETDCAAVEALAGTSDVLLLDGETQVTWGDADGGKALMPLNRPF